MSKFNKPEFCPDWFDLNNYRKLEYFTRQDFDIATRARLLVNSSAHKNKEYAKEIMNDLSLDNLPLCIKDNEYISTSIEVLGLDGVFDEFCNQSINDMSIIDGFNKAGEIIKKIHKVSTSDNSRLDYSEFFSKLERISRGLKGRKTDSLLLSVTTTELSDDVLVEQFKKKLTEHRQENKESGKRLSDYQIKGLIENRVFPYIDLLLWGKSIGNQLTQAQMANLIFPDLYDVDIVNKLRLSTIPKAEQILSGEIKFI